MTLDALLVNPEVVIARLRARLTAKYQLVAVPGRPEELEHSKSGRRVSVVYGGLGSVRIRLQEGRVWGETIDFPLDRALDSEHAVRLAFRTDAHFGLQAGAMALDLGRPSRDIPMA